MKVQGKGRGKIPGKLIALAVIAVLIVAFGLSRCGGSREETAEWPTDGLAALLPDPVGTVESVDMDDETLRASFRDCSDGDYGDYLAACEEMGYTVDASILSTDSTYEAYSTDGYHLTVMSFSGEDISVDLEAPMELSAISWPSSGAAGLVPAPSSTTGSISSDSSDFFFAYVGATPIEEFSAYVDACSNAGFNVDYDRSDTHYSAKDAQGNSLRVEYMGNSIISVRVEVNASDESTSDETAPVEAEDSTPAETEPAGSSSVSPDFKATMDEYEAFFNEYCDFMESYSQNPSDPTLITEYASMMSQYSDAMAALDAIDEGSLSAADSAYYLEVQTRTNQRLLEVGESLS